MRKTQDGITLIGFIIVLAVAGFFAYIGMQLFPMYTEFYAVKAAMKKVQLTPGSSQMSVEQIWRILDNNFYTSYVNSVKRTDVTLDKKNGVWLRVKYEVRKPLVYNIDVVGKFEHSEELTRSGG